LKIVELGDSSYKLAVSVQSNPDGSMYNSAKAPKKKTTGKIYDSNFVRHWDTYVTAQRPSIWYGDLSKGKTNSSSSHYSLGELTNALKGTKLVSPIPPFGGSDNYDLSETGLAFVAKDPILDPSTHTQQNLYFMPWSSGAQGIQQLKDSGLHGANSSPVFAPGGKSLAFLAMAEDGYEADKNQVVIIPDITKTETQAILYATENNKGSWDRSPSNIIWSKDGSKLYFLADNMGRTGVFVGSVAAQDVKSSPKLIRSSDGISDLTVLQDGTLFISANTLIDNSVWYTLNLTEDNMDYNLVSTNSANGNKFGLSSSQIDEIWWEGQLQSIHAWVLKPSNFDESKKYPLAYLIHGGPQGAWGNSWSTRWNPAVFAEQGYVVICPNPTGSTGYGQLLTDSIQNEWGGIPYDDLVRGFEYIENNLEYVDTDRAVALGASYGG
jgi:dipeptidyl aminopeptidase/acylaminoacyl peptidase